MSRQVVTAERYERAAAFLPQHIGLKLTGAVNNGYWIDDHRYFFCVSEAVDGQQQSAPSIADAVNGSVSPVLEIETLAGLISAQCDKAIASVDLASAVYDMPNAATLVVTLGVDSYHITLDKFAMMRAETLDPVAALHSPDGRYAAFLKGHDLWVKDRESGATQPLTTDGEAYYAYGRACESGASPISERNHPAPVGLWSQDSQWFVSHRIDERYLPEGALVEHAPSGNRRPIPHIFKVAGPDVDRPKAEFIAWHLPTGRIIRAVDRTVIAQIFCPFSARQCWFTEDRFYFFDWDRYASEVSLVAMDLATGAVWAVMTETADSGWINLHPLVMGQPMVRPLSRSGELIWYSQSDGRGHLYLHDLTNGSLKCQITEGPWVVRELIYVDEVKRRILFLASGFTEDCDPCRRRLCAINFDGSGFETIFVADGDLAVNSDPMAGVDQYNPFRPSYAPSGVSPDGRYVAATLGSADQATQALLIDTKNGRQLEIARLNIDALWHAPKPQPFEALAADGVTKLVGAMYFPSDFDVSKSYPLVAYIYPGPQISWFARRFSNAMALMLQSVVELGMVGIILETRGTPNRDRAFHQAGKGRLHEPQLGDHAAVIEQLCQRHTFLDRSRIGIFGQSGGGYATARALFDYPNIFKVGVSVCGNHDNRNYIAHWIDKFGGRPGTEERNDQANVSVAHKLQGKLLLMHGDMDDNVHPAHTLALSAALIAAGKDFDQLIMPGITHAVLSESPYAMQRLWTYFARHLLDAGPPANFKLEWTASGATVAMSMFRNYYYAEGC